MTSSNTTESTSADGDHARAGSSEWLRADDLSIIGVALAALSVFVWRQVQWTGGFLGFPLDDSYIHLQFAQRLAAGDGLSFRDAEGLVAGSTSPLWTALVAIGFVGSSIFGSPLLGVLASKILGVLLFVWTGIEVRRLALRLGAGRLAATFAGVACVLTDTLVFSALSGMEVPLFAALTVRGVRCFVEEDRAASVAGAVPPLVAPSVWMLALASLARPEGLLLLGLAVLSRLFAWLRAGQAVRAAAWSGAQAALLAALMLVPVATLFWAWHGSPLPTTFSVKAGGDHRLWPASRDAWRFAEVLFRVQPWLLIFSAAGALRLVRERRTLLPALWVLALPLAYSAMTSAGEAVLLGNFGRYAFPLLPFVIVLGALALDELFEVLVSMGSAAVRRWAPLALCLLVLWPGLRATWVGAQRAGVAAMNVAQTDVSAALWIRENLPSARVGAQDIGALGFFTDNELVDLVGLVNPEILAFTRGARQMDGLAEYIARRGVDHVLLFPASYGGEEAVLRRWPGLVEVRRWRTAPNVAMAAGELVLYRKGGG